jgi:hypothetical protein
MKGFDVNFLVLIHDVFTGNVVRQLVVKAENEAGAFAATHHLVNENEHAVVVPTGSEPTIQPERPSPMAEPVLETTDLDEIHETPVIPPPPDPADLIVDELKALPDDVLKRVREFLAQNA